MRGLASIKTSPGYASLSELRLLIGHSVRTLSRRTQKVEMVSPNYGTKFDTMSLRACYLELCGVGEPRHASGFFWRYDGKVYLITNWHVVTGTSPLDGKSKGWCPEKLLVEFFPKAVQEETNFAINNIPIMEIELFEEFNSPFWLQHPMMSEWGVDIVAIEITEQKVKDRLSLPCVNDFNFPRLYHFAGSEVFVLGHPRSRYQSKYPVAFPIWKRASIASELIVPFDMRPAFLIDSRTSGGMSGSPVFSRVFGPAAYADGSIKMDNILVSEFMGIYSGRLHDDEDRASLGLVWHRNLIEQILTSRCPGSRIWQPSKSLEIFTEMRKEPRSSPN
jgi:hypothetical protein